MCASRGVALKEAAGKALSEDLNDHEELCTDPPLAAACGRADLFGEKRHLKRGYGNAEII